jgi:hypothetical protein
MSYAQCIDCPYPHPRMERMMGNSRAFFQCPRCKVSRTQMRSVAEDYDGEKPKHTKSTKCETLEQALDHLAGWRRNPDCPLKPETQLRKPKELQRNTWAVTTDQRWCPCKGEEHTKNTLWVLVNLNAGTLTIRCYDSSHAKQALAVHRLPGFYRCTCWKERQCLGCEITRFYEVDQEERERDWEGIAKRQAVELATKWGPAVRELELNNSNALFEMEERFSDQPASPPPPPFSLYPSFNIGELLKRPCGPAAWAYLESCRVSSPSSS